MKVINHTPFPHLLIERRDADDGRLGVLMLEASFRLAPGGAMRLLERQPPVHVGDVYRGDPRTTSLERATSTATLKPNADIHIDAIARSPGGPRTEWPVRIRVGSLQRDLAVRGPHSWTRTALGWRLGTPAPCAAVPLVYEHAFGGRVALEDGRVVEEPRNPVGTGFLPRGLAATEPIAAPQVVSLEEPPHRPGARYAPVGCGPIPPHFAPRTERIGTCDEAWRQTRWPRVPADFDYAHYQSAHPDLVYPGFLEGGEAVELVHLGARGGSIVTALPRLEPKVLVRLAGGGLTGGRLRCDTLFLSVASEDPAEHRAVLTWRLMFPWKPAVRGLEVRVAMPAAAPRVERAHG